MRNGIWQRQQNPGSRSLIPSQWDHSQASSQGKLWHKWTHSTFFLRIIFGERDELGVKLKQSSVLEQLCLTILHRAPWLQLLQPQQLEFLAVSSPIQTHSHCPTALTTHTARSQIPWESRELQVLWLLLSHPQVFLTRRTSMNASNGFFLS